MTRYFKVVEIDREEFMKASGEDLDCIQMTFPCNGMEYVAVDDNKADEFLFRFGGWIHATSSNNRFTSYSCS